LLMLDEPTNHLDIGSRLTLENALRQYDGAVILVSHDRYFLDNVVTRVIEISDGHATSYAGNYSEYLYMKGVRDAKIAAENGDKPAPPAKVAVVNAQELSAQINGVPKRESDAERRARQDEEKKSRNRLKKAEKEIEEHEEKIYQLETRISELENELAKPRKGGDFSELATVGNELKEVRAEKDRVEANWMKLQEEVEQLTTQLSEI
ncbi:MAG TPA: hypothetical protein PK988_10730, partial [Candidatus Sumerlaeota bacterium]|nr:hypothetical protein [Candidatus Sumerlaeota bacterium]